MREGSSNHFSTNNPASDPRSEAKSFFRNILALSLCGSRFYPDPTRSTDGKFLLMRILPNAKKKIMSRIPIRIPRPLSAMKPQPFKRLPQRALKTSACHRRPTRPLLRTTQFVLGSRREVTSTYARRNGNPSFNVDSRAARQRHHLQRLAAGSGYAQADE